MMSVENLRPLKPHILGTHCLVMFGRDQTNAAYAALDTTMKALGRSARVSELPPKNGPGNCDCFMCRQNGYLIATFQA